jgi:Ni,Fe-hydrogenase III large subunit
MKSASSGAACSTCSQHTRLLRIEGEAAKVLRKYTARDETIRMYLLELGGAVAAVGKNVDEQLASLKEKVEEIAEKVAGKRTGGNGSRP